MNLKDASRIQSNADKTGKKWSLKQRSNQPRQKMGIGNIVFDHQSDMDNHSDQLNPNNDEYRGD